MLLKPTLRSQQPQLLSLLRCCTGTHCWKAAIRREGITASMTFFSFSILLGGGLVATLPQNRCLTLARIIGRPKDTWLGYMIVLHPVILFSTEHPGRKHAGFQLALRSGPWSSCWEQKISELRPACWEADSLEMKMDLHKGSWQHLDLVHLPVPRHSKVFISEAISDKHFSNLLITFTES